MFEKVIVTEFVAEEYGDTLPDYIEIRKLTNIQTFKELQNKLDRGEASSIALSLEIPDSLLLLDEQDARSVASERKLRFIGVLGILLVAKEEKRISEIKPFLNELKHSGMWVSDKVIHEVLRLVNEL